jgi:hypothetical protein
VHTVNVLSPRNALTKFEICSKPVVLFDSHHYALLPWADWRSSLSMAPRLLSLDYHTDKHRAFWGWSFAQADPYKHFTADPELDFGHSRGIASQFEQSVELGWGNSCWAKPLLGP